jgi:hypothetical protein
MENARGMTVTKLPKLSEKGHVIVVTAYPPQPGGTCVLMQNLLKCFDPASFSVVTGDTKGPIAVSDQKVTIHRILSSIKFSTRLHRKWQDIQLPWAISKLVRLIKSHRPSVLVGVYPEYNFLYIACEAARRTKTPLVAYLHDTMVEALSESPHLAKGTVLQERTFKEASRILVMSQGMADLYARKYSLDCMPLEHSYPEAIPESLPETAPVRQAFWGGAIYAINTRAVGRVAKALEEIDTPLLLATNTTFANLEQDGINGKHIKIDFYSSRKDYLEALQKQGILVLALDYPDESPVHEDELSTIFPTKTPEYLASGRPILVHCPEHYFLARFIRERKCGLVVSERSVPALVEACKTLLDSPETVQQMTRNALEAAQLFSADRVSTIFKEEVTRAAGVQWGQKLPL